MRKEMEFLAEKALKRETNRFLEEIEHFMEDGGIEKLLAGEKTNDHKKGKGEKQQKVPGRKQFKMLMDAAEEASCIEELLLFLSYQKSKKHGWETTCSDGEAIAKKLADSFMRIQDDIYKIIENEDWAEKIEDDDERLLRLMIANKYLGYLYWKASAVSRF